MTQQLTARHRPPRPGRHRAHPNLVVPYVAPTVSLATAVACASGAVAAGAETASDGGSEGARALWGAARPSSPGSPSTVAVPEGASRPRVVTVAGAEAATATGEPTASEVRAAARASRGSGRTPVSERTREAREQREASATTPAWVLTGALADRARSEREREIAASRASRSAAEREARQAEEAAAVARAAAEREAARVAAARQAEEERREAAAQKAREAAAQEARERAAEEARQAEQARQAAARRAEEARKAEQARLAALAAQAPTLSRPLRGGVITSGYGWRWGRMHNGIDYGVPTGTSLLAVSDATVVFSGWYFASGQRVILEREDGTQFMYAHMSERYVSVGQRVEAGQVLGLSGNTGRSTGPHLHFEVHVNGAPVNPYPWLSSRGIL